MVLFLLYEFFRSFIIANIYLYIYLLKLLYKNLCFVFKIVEGIYQDISIHLEKIVL